MIDHAEVVARLRSVGAPTPCYYLDLDAVAATLAEVAAAFSAVFDRFALAYSFKTNSAAAVTRLVADGGHHAEVVSGAELELALRDGFPGERICFDGPVKTPAELRAAVAVGALVQVDSPTEVADALAAGRALGREPRITVRLATGGRRRWSRLGMTPAEVRATVRLLERAGVPCLGVHFNSGAHRLSVDAYVRVLRSWRRGIRELAAAAGARPLIVDVGGGFPAHSAAPGVELPPWAHYAEGLADGLAGIGVDPDHVQLVIEPGRAMVEDHGYLVLGAAAIKRRGREQVVTLDGGSNLVHSLRAWHHPLTIHPAGPQRTRLVGSMCFEHDILAERVAGPRVIDGDTRVVVGSCGGYDIPSARGWIRSLPSVWARTGGRDVPLPGVDVFNDLRVHALTRAHELVAA